MLVSTGKCVAVMYQSYFRYLGHRYGSALRGAHHHRPTRPCQFRRHLLSRLHFRGRYLLDHSKQPRSLSCQEPQALFVTNKDWQIWQTLKPGKTHSIWKECPQPRNTFHRELSFLHSSKSHFLWWKVKP